MRIWPCLLLWLGLALPALAEPLPAKGSVEVLFSPWDDAEGAIIRVVDEARQTLHVQAYLITSRAIARALTAAYARGLRVAVLADREMLVRGENSQLPALAAAGIELRLETRYAAAHNKIILADAASARPVVVSGSYNFTWSAQARNAENLLILRGHPELARRYLDNWQRHHAEAMPYDEADYGK